MLFGVAFRLNLGLKETGEDRDSSVVAGWSQITTILRMLVVMAAFWRISEASTICKLQKDVLWSAP